jgi:hypothetical protein
VRFAPAEADDGRTSRQLEDDADQLRTTALDGGAVVT